MADRGQETPPYTESWLHYPLTIQALSNLASPCLSSIICEAETVFALTLRFFRATSGRGEVKFIYLLTDEMVSGTANPSMSQIQLIHTTFALRNTLLPVLQFGSTAVSSS